MFIEASVPLFEFETPVWFLRDLSSHTEETDVAQKTIWAKTGFCCLRLPRAEVNVKDK